MCDVGKPPSKAATLRMLKRELAKYAMSSERSAANISSTARVWSRRGPNNYAPTFPSGGVV